MSVTLDLFAAAVSTTTTLNTDAVVLHGYALPNDAEIINALELIVRDAPLRHMITPGGFSMSVAMTNCGRYGWVTDRNGYRYTEADPDSGLAWPSMPLIFSELATQAANAAGFKHFIPDACLINRYEAGARMSLHQDKNERDFSQPIVSVSFGLPATFLFGGLKRSERVQRVLVHHGDVVVWGGESRLRYHGVSPLKTGLHPSCGPYRFNLTFRRAN